MSRPDGPEAIGHEKGRVPEGEPDDIPVVSVGANQLPPWGDDRTCPACGEPDLPLRASDPPLLHWIRHCDQTWLRGPINRLTR